LLGAHRNLQITFGFEYKPDIWNKYNRKQKEEEEEERG
jgi:hypothetical protein